MLSESRSLAFLVLPMTISFYISRLRLSMLVALAIAIAGPGAAVRADRAGGYGPDIEQRRFGHARRIRCRAAQAADRGTRGICEQRAARE
jgi:hypothetical protein